MPPDGMTLPARYYTDASLFAAELERFFRRMWVCVSRTDDIPEPGSYILRDVAGESLILVRHAPDGGARLVDPAARRRSTDASVGSGTANPAYRRHCDRPRGNSRYDEVKQRLRQHVPKVDAPISDVHNGRTVNDYFAELLEEASLPVRRDV